MEEYFTYCDELQHRSPERLFTTREPSPSFNINLYFSCDFYCSHWILHTDSTTPEFVKTDNPLEIDNSIAFTLEEFLSYKQSRETLEESLKDWPLMVVGRREFVDYALKRVRDAIVIMPAHHNVLHLQFRVMALHKRYLVDRRFVNWMIQQLLEENTMVPASDSSIESLETKILVDDHGTCSICLEEFLVDGVCEGVCMPCKHIFHGDCIQKWLRTSHYCPICRYEMPTS
ncbi:hypothetical protein BUALT_Bualt16G0101300 [Buddleja alternifolia]|uniref:RING-type E3 ubiquitin transferase n=1 Tax=Buddleja alternifolia TaxID=168488 RepID=A0AAV6WL49_9LAMI|nr:hypothetical protein BUALT_Bualt16G0101300 [Buddleja alternifolia]